MASTETALRISGAAFFGIALSCFERMITEDDQALRVIEALRFVVLVGLLLLVVTAKREESE